MKRTLGFALTVGLADAIAIIKEQQKKDGKLKSRARKDSDEADEVFVFVGSGASIQDRAKKAPARIAQLLNIDFRGHDLRRTAATKMAEAGVPRQHISAVLNHVEAGATVTRVYDRYNYDAEKRRALEMWARTLNAILKSAEPGKLLPFGGVARG
jgi:integrase